MTCRWLGLLTRIMLLLPCNTGFDGCKGVASGFHPLNGSSTVGNVAKPETWIRTTPPSSGFGAILHAGGILLRLRADNRGRTQADRFRCATSTRIRAQRRSVGEEDGKPSPQAHDPLVNGTMEAGDAPIQLKEDGLWSDEMRMSTSLDVQKQLGEDSSAQYWRAIDNEYINQFHKQRGINGGDTYDEHGDGNSDGYEPSFRMTDRANSVPEGYFALRHVELGKNSHLVGIDEDAYKFFVERAKYGGRGQYLENRLDEASRQLRRVEEAIIANHANGTEFNVNSPRQVAKLLFGNATRSTSKQVLERMARHSEFASLMLKHRTIKSSLSRLQRKKEHQRMKMRHFWRKRRARTALKHAHGNFSADSTISMDASSEQQSEAVDDDALWLVDASAYIFRAYHSMPPMHRGDGMPVGAVLGFCNMLNRMLLNRMLNQERPRLVLVFDAPGPTFRNEIYPLYKAQRPDVPVDLIPQFSLIREAGRAYGIPQVEAAGFEADDVIATLACKATQMGMDVNILSGDKDLMQLITPNASASDGGVGVCQMIDPMKMSRVDHDAVIEKWNVNSDQLGDVLALAGDAADNVPGVPGIGPKIAAQLINEYGSLDGIYENVYDIKQKKRRETLMENEDQARLSRVLVELERDVPFGSMIRPADETAMDAGELSVMRMTELDVDRVISFYDDMGFTKVKQQMTERLRPQSEGASASAKNSTECIDCAKMEGNANPNHSKDKDRLGTDRADAAHAAAQGEVQINLDRRSDSNESDHSDSGGRTEQLGEDQILPSTSTRQFFAALAEETQHFLSSAPAEIYLSAHKQAKSKGSRSIDEWEALVADPPNDIFLTSYKEELFLDYYEDENVRKALLIIASKQAAVPTPKDYDGVPF